MKQDYPNNLIDFIDRFSSEDSCLEYLSSVKWRDGFTCPACGGKESWVVNDSGRRCRSCRHVVTVYAGTVMQDTKLPARIWLTAMWLLASRKDGISAKALQESLGLSSYKNAWLLMAKLRTAMVRSDRCRLSGTVEVDETPVGGILEGGKRGRGSENKELVAVAVQLRAIKGATEPLKRYTLSKIRMTHVKSASRADLHGFIAENIEPGSTVITDGLGSYRGLEALGYRHEVHVVSKAIGEEEKLHHVDLVISLLDRWILGTYQGRIDKSHLQTYLDEFVFRFNRKESNSRGLVFYRLVEGAVAATPKTYKELVRQV